MNPGSTLPALERELGVLGFAPVGEARYIRGPVALAVGETWLTLRGPREPRSPDLLDCLDRPGLWKCGSHPYALVCDLPRRVCTPADDDGGTSVLTQAIEWALATRVLGRALPSAQAEASAGLEPLEVPPPVLTARAGALTCQGELHRDPEGPWIDYRIAPIPADLSPAGRRWLTALLRATHRFRMVRVATAAETDLGSALHARVDLRGLGAAARDTLLATAIPLLRTVVARLLPAIDLLTVPETDAAVVSRAWELGTPLGTPTLEKRELLQ